MSNSFWNKWLVLALVLGGLGAGFWVALGETFLVSSENPARGAAAPPGNRLGDALSPYLREASHQPVHWSPWGQEAFRQAQEEDKPILLDIGAIWCHWCHVMDVESYENEAIAALINEDFVAIKVDRDERPDIDRRYQEAVQALTGGGGWPLTAFLTADGQVFFGGTYFPPENRGGRPGLKTLLPALSKAYKSQRDEVVASAGQLSTFLTRMATQSTKPGTVSEQLVDAITTRMTQNFDAVNGGFGTGVKFPAASAVELVLARDFAGHDPTVLRIATKTLDAMAQGGVYDHIGGGFFRYSTDPRWRVPHFEKMNYDNASLLTNYLHAYQATGTPRYREIAQGIMEYLNTVLSDQTRGGFYAHQDADMTREDDGDYYTWTVEEVKNALPKDEAAVTLRYYDIQPRGEMREHPAKNVPFVSATPTAIAAELGISVEHTVSLLSKGRHGLLRARMTRNAPVIDQTLYSDRNGMLISAYLEAFQALGDEQAREFALTTLDLFIRTAYQKGRGMYHALFQGTPRHQGLLNDQVQMANALLDSFQVTGDQAYLVIAKDLMDYAIAHFWDPQGGGFFDRRPEESPLAALARLRKDFTDNPTASANAVAALVLDRLAYLTNDDAYKDKARKTLQAFAGSADGAGRFAAAYALAVHYHLTPSAQIVVIGKQDDPRTQALWTSAMKTYRPGKLVAVYDPAQLDTTQLPPAVAGAVKVFGVHGKPQAYVCAGSTCAPPTGDSREVAALAKTYGVTH